MKGSPSGSVAKNLPANAGDTGLISGKGRCLARGNGNPPQYSCLENPTDRRAGGLQSMGWQKSQTQLSSNNNKHQHVIVNLEQKKTTNKFSQKSITITLLISSFPTSLSLDLLVKVAQSCLTLCDPLNCSSPGSSVHEIFSGKNTGVGCHFLLQGILLTQESNPHFLCLLHCRQVLYLLSH